MPVIEREAAGLEYVHLVTELLHRIRLADESAGVWEAADLQWWWRKPRVSDEIGQTFWLDRAGPLAAVILTDWDRTWGCDPIVSPDAPDGLLGRVWSRALHRIESLSLDLVEVMVDDADAEMLALLGAAGFTASGQHGASTSMRGAVRPSVPVPPDGFRLLDRATASNRPHHMTARNGAAVAERLAECTLYRPDLDLYVEGPDGDAASYGLFWFDPVTKVGLVEPMRTEDAHQRRGLARCVLAAGLERLAALGSRRLKVSYEAANPASRSLYLSAGFRPLSFDSIYSRRRG